MTEVGTRSSGAHDELQLRTVRNFGEQWTKYVENDGYYGSKELFADICGPLLRLDELTGMRAADIGSGTGRIVNMLIGAGAAHVLAIEPSNAFAALERNTKSLGNRVSLLCATGEMIPDAQELDLVTAIGVLHHVPNPVPLVCAVRHALRPGGRVLIWVYAHEGNERYLAAVRPLRILTTRLPHGVLAFFSGFVAVIASAWHAAASRLGLPEAEYLKTIFCKLTFANKRLVIYDQLRPAYAKYYRESEICALLESCGFAPVTTYYRHGYSWTAVGYVPETSSTPRIEK
jgi:SAM-dependent methyltransferase